ncbi:MAG: hypothetical protein O2816_16320 [Planctomycetota bacterium]|nr:hypothetical protein [Planctomycetota bacterium]
MRVLDVDGGKSDVFEFYDEDDVLIEAIEIAALGENSVQSVESDNGPIVGVRRIAMVLGGSGAIARLRWCPGDHGND